MDNNIINQNWSTPEIAVTVVGALIVFLVIATVVIPILYEAVFKKRRRKKWTQ
jgi:multidrug efflux pump subunit AcrB